MSDTAAIGIPKLEAGPQKSGFDQYRVLNGVDYLDVRVEQK
jgi:hypothetical protein